MKRTLILLLGIGTLIVGANIDKVLNAVEPPPPVPVLHIGVMDVADNPTKDETDFIESHPLSRPALTLAALLTFTKTDPALAAFYQAQGFDVSCAKATVLTSNRFALASWRRGSNFGFGATPAIIAAGEIVFTSCGNQNVIVRAKCGNVMLLTDSAQSITSSPLEVSELLSGAVPPPASTTAPPEHPSVSVPPTEPQPPSDGPPGTPFGPPISCCGGTPNTPVVPPVPVPEPSSLALTTLGVFILFVIAGLACRS